MNIIVNKDTPQFASWYKAIIDNHNAHMAKLSSTLTPDIFSVNEGSRYLGIFREKQDYGVQRSIHAFIDRTTGDVLKPASWRAPAKHARGNIFNPDNGLSCMGPYGPCYLRG